MPFKINVQCYVAKMQNKNQSLHERATAHAHLSQKVWADLLSHWSSVLTVCRCLKSVYATKLPFQITLLLYSQYGDR